jgi:hypothetical protein
MMLTRRAWGAALAAAMAHPRTAPLAAQTPSTSARQDLEEIRRQEQSNYEAMRKVRLPRATEPSFKFLP